MLSPTTACALALSIFGAAASAAPMKSNTPRVLTLRTVDHTVSVTAGNGSRVFSSALAAPTVRVTASSRFPRSLTLAEASGKVLWSVAPGAEGLTLTGPWAGKGGGVFVPALSAGQAPEAGGAPRSVTLTLGPKDTLLMASVSAAPSRPALGFQCGTDPTGFYFQKSLPVYGATYNEDDTGGVFEFGLSRFVFQKATPPGTLDMALNEQHIVFPAGTRFHADTLESGQIALVGMAPAGSALVCRL